MHILTLCINVHLRKEKNASETLRELLGLELDNNGHSHDAVRKEILTVDTVAQL